MKNKVLNFLLTLLTIFGLYSCNSGNNDSEYVINDENLKITEKYDNNQTFYEIFVGAFSDSNGDGIGDLRGLINRLDYLNDGDPNSGKSLGVTGIWLMPIFTSSSYHKYDVMNYYTVDSDYGTMDDLKELIDECHKRDITLIIDLPINHTSSICSWFIRFKEALAKNDLENEYASYYSKCKVGAVPAGRTFKSVGGTNWMYECNFDSGMPELDFDSQLVRDEVLKIARYYLELGIDGFRFDAAKYIYFGDNKASIDFWSWYMTELKKIKSDIYCVAEVWDGVSLIKDYYNAVDCFDFPYSGAEGLISTAAKGGNVSTFISNLISYNNDIKNKNSNNVMAPFISNHDMDRAAGYLSISSGNAYSAASLLLLTNTTPFIYYGEEIGMKGSRGSVDTDANRRLAMLWGDDDTVKDPKGTTYSKDKQINGTVAEQLKEEESLYNHYKKLIMMRNYNKEISNGTYEFVNLKSKSSVGGFIARLDNSSCMVIHNTGDEEAEIDLSNYDYRTINSYAGINTASINNNMLKLGGKTSVVLR